MITLKISGRKTVKTLKKEFKTAFDATLRVFDDMNIAEDTATLASVRKSSNKSGEIMLRGNILVSNFEKIMIEDFGIKIQVADKNNEHLVNNSLTLSKCGILKM